MSTIANNPPCARNMAPKTFVTLGMFIIDTFSYENSDVTDDSRKLVTSAEVGH